VNHQAHSVARGFFSKLLELFALPSFIERMVKIAPKLDLASVHFDPREVAALLANGAMDVVVGAETFDNPSLKRMKVVQDHLIVAARWPPSRHPAADFAAELPSC
jgi:hypothetical protein